MSIDIYLIALFIVTGFVVSLDVTGLTLSKSRYFSEHPNELFAWSLSNGMWHAGLLLLYIITLSGVLRFAPALIDQIAEALKLFIRYLPLVDIELANYISVVARSLAVHAPVLLGIAALCILWSTYSDKIKSVPSTGNINDLSPLARIAFNFIDLCVRLLPRSRVSESKLVRLIYWQAQAALVAVDMLALAALLKSMKVLDTWNSRLLVCAIVFLSVAGLAAAAGAYGRAAYARIQAAPNSAALLQSRAWILITIRLGEPFLIFYFALQLVAFLIFGAQIHSVSFFLAAGLLVAALVSKHTLPLIVERTLTEPPINQPSLEQLRPLSAVFASISKDLYVCAKWIGYAVLLALVFAIFLYIKAMAGLGERNPSSISLESEVSIFLGILKAISACLILLNVKAFHHLEDAMAQYLQAIVKSSHAYLFVVVALFIAAVFPIHVQLMAGLNAARLSAQGASFQSLGFVENHKHVLQLALWLIYFLVLAGACTAVRERWSVEIAGADSEDRKVRNGLWRSIFFGFYVFAATLLGFIGWLQAAIMPAN